MKNSDLLPCPFCGKKVKFQNVMGSYGYTSDTVEISCCISKVSEAAEAFEPKRGYFSVLQEARKKVADKWNTRTIRSRT